MTPTRDWFEWIDAPQGDFAVIGDPIHHSKSPAMHQAAYHALGLSHRYVAIRVPVGEVAAALTHLTDLGYKGVNVTVPHKEEACAACHDREPFCGRTRVANTIRLPELACINTDAPGFLETLHLVNLPNRKVLFLGSGGTARALVPAAEDAGFEIGLWNRTRSRAESLVVELNLRCEVLEEPRFDHAGLVVNSTSSSLHGEALPIAWESLETGAIAFDLMYGPEPTQFEQDAHKAGLQSLSGRELLVAQGALAFRYWLGVDPPREVMRQALF